MSLGLFSLHDDYDDFIMNVCRNQQRDDGLGFTGLDTELSPIALCSPSLFGDEELDHSVYEQRTRNLLFDVQFIKAEPLEVELGPSHAFQRSQSAEPEKTEGFEPSLVFADYDDTIEALNRAKRALHDEELDEEVFVESPGSDSSSINSTPPPITPPNHLSPTIPLPAHLLNSTKDSDSLQSDDAALSASSERSGRPLGVTTSTNTDGHATRTGYATPPIMQNSSSLDRGELPPSPGATRTHRHSHSRHSPYPTERVHRGDRVDRSQYRLHSLSPPPTNSSAPTGEAPIPRIRNSPHLPRLFVSDDLGRLRSAKWSPPNSSREGSESPPDDATHPSQGFVPRLIRPPPSYASGSHARSSSAPHHLPPLQMQDYHSSRYYPGPPTHDRSVSHPSSYAYPNRGEFPVSSERGISHDPPSPNSATPYPPLSSSSHASSSRSYARHPHSPYSASTEYGYANPPVYPSGVTAYRTDYNDHPGKRPARSYRARSSSENSNSESDDDNYDMDDDVDYSTYKHGQYPTRRSSPPSSRTSSTSRFGEPPNMGHLNMGPSNSVFSANSSAHSIPNGIPLLLSAASTAGLASGSRKKKNKLQQGEMEIPPPPKPTATPTPAFAKKKKSNTGRIKVEEQVLDGQRRFLCPLYNNGSCRQTFSRRNDAYRHLDSCHRDLMTQAAGEEPPPPGVMGPDRCGCGQLLSRLDALNRHYKTCKWRKEQGLPPPAPTSAQAGKKKSKGGKNQSTPKKGGSGKNRAGSSSGRSKHSGTGTASDDEQGDWDEEDELESEEEEGSGGNGDGDGDEEEDQLMDE